MKLTINTIKLQEMVSKAIKGASSNKMIPLTGLISIKLNSGELCLTTTDATNYLYIREQKVVGDDFEVVVPIETFSKLVAKMTSENITLESAENSLIVKGNGTYNLELPVDENGDAIKFPEAYPAETIWERIDSINLSTIKTILASVKPALATSLEVPCYTGYYVGDKVVATDTYKITGLNINLFDRNVLVSPEMMNLLDVIDTENILVDISGDLVAFTTDTCSVYGHLMEGIEDYSIGAINGLLEQEFGSMCKLPKNEVLGVLDRISLFVGNYDKGAIKLTFTRDGLQIESRTSNGIETIPYTDSKNYTDYVCTIDVEMLKSQVKAQAGDLIELWYGEDNAIKLVDGNITSIVALLEDE